MPSPSLLLPVETLNREFDGKLLLALHAAERGWDVVIGKRSTLHDQLWRFPRSIYFSKDVRATNGPIFRILSQLGHSIVGLDEEGLVHASDEMFVMRIDPANLRYLRRAFAWGENEARLLRTAAGSADLPAGLPIVVTGNPRVDMLRPELARFHAREAERIRARYGRFLLFNTNFSLANHFIARHTRFRVADWVPKARVSEMRGGYVEHKTRLMQAFIRLIPRLAEAISPCALVIRPHPSERHQTWVEAARGMANVHVVHEGTVVPWLAAAEVLLHNGCTSAIEAAVLGTPALAYRPVRQPGYDHELPNGVSLEHDDEASLIGAARAQLEHERQGRQALDPARHDLLAHHIAALEGPLASARLVDELERCAEAPAAAGRRGVGMARLAARRAYRAVRKRLPRAKGNPVYLRHKFPGIGVGEVNERLARLAGALGRFDGFAAEEIRPDLFAIVRRPGGAQAAE